MAAPATPILIENPPPNFLPVEVQLQSIKVPQVLIHSHNPTTIAGMKSNRYQEVNC